MRPARSTEECACSDATTTRRSGLRAARGTERGERRGRGGVLDVTVPLAGRPSSCPIHESVSSSSSVTAGDVRQSMPLAFSVAVSSSARMPGLRRRDAEVGEEARVVPVRDARHQHAVEVGEHVRERLRLLGRRRRELRADLAGRDRRHHGSLADALEIVGRPVDRGMAVGPELLRIRHAGEATVRPRAATAGARCGGAAAARAARRAAPAGAGTPPSAGAAGPAGARRHAPP